MACETQEGPVLVRYALVAARRQIVAPANQCRRPAVLQAAITAAGRIQKKQVAIEIRWRSQESKVLPADRLQVPAQARHIDAGIAPYGNRVRDAFDFELANRQLPALDGVIDQFGVIARRVAAETILFCGVAPHRCCDSPVLSVRWFGREYLDIARQRLLSDHGGKYAGAVKECMVVVEMCATNALVVCEHLEYQCQRARCFPRAPAALVELFKRDFPAVGFRTNRNDVPRIVADHVAAGNPGRHREDLAVRIRVRHGHADLEKVCGRIERSNAVSVRFAHRLSLHA